MLCASIFNRIYIGIRNILITRAVIRYACGFVEAFFLKINCLTNVRRSWIGKLISDRTWYLTTIRATRRVSLIWQLSASTFTQRTIYNAHNVCMRVIDHDTALANIYAESTTLYTLNKLICVCMWYYTYSMYRILGANSSLIKMSKHDQLLHDEKWKEIKLTILDI